MITLKDPITIQNLKLKNRLVMPPMATSKAGEDGMVNRSHIDYYHDKTKSGKIGLVIMEHVYVSPEGKANPGQVYFGDPSGLDSLKKLTGTVHGSGTPIFVQISHAGSKAKQAVTGLQPVSASPVCCPSRQGPGDMPRELSKEEIRQLVQAFKNAALLAKEAGFDGVEIHSAHGYLLNQFYSPLTNKRNDEYGGSLMNRIRIHLEIIEAVRQAVGKDFPVALRLGAVEDLENGNTVQDAVEACQAFEKAGVDLLDISGSFLGYIRDGHPEPGYFASASKTVKENVSVPVIVTGGIQTSGEADILLQQEAADLIGVGRAILVDSDWPEKNL